jgi:hypothetical protein
MTYIVTKHTITHVFDEGKQEIVYSRHTDRGRQIEEEVRRNKMEKTTQIISVLGMTGLAVATSSYT